MPDAVSHDLLFGLCVAMTAVEFPLAGIFACEALVLTSDHLNELRERDSELQDDQGPDDQGGDEPYGDDPGGG